MSRAFCANLRYSHRCVRGAGPRARCAGRTPRSCAGRSTAAISALSPLARGSTNSSRSSSPFPPCSTLLVRDRSRHGRANGRRTVPRLRLGRVYLLAHDPGMLADLPDPAEPVVLEQLDGRAEQEPPNGFATSGHLGDRLDETATRCGDLLERAAEGSPRDALPAMLFVNVEAGDPPVRQRWRVLFVFAPVLDGRKFFGAAVLAPSLSDPVVVEDQRRVRPALANLGLLGGAIPRVTGAVHLKAFRVKAHAPAAAEDAIIALDYLRERVPGRGVKRPDTIRNPLSHRQQHRGGVGSAGKSISQRAAG